MRGLTGKSITSYLVFAMIIAYLVTFQGGCQSSSTTTTPPSTPAETAGTPAATDTVTITSSGTPAPTPEASATPNKKSTEVQPYSLSKGRRDPFVPFGGAVPASGGGAQTQAPVVTAPKGPTGTIPSVAPPVSTGGGQESGMPESVPVQVTGTYASGGKNYAILTSASGGPSFVVSTGDKVGEYKVKSISATRVVLSWSGRDYVLKMKTFGPHSGAGSKASVTEEHNKSTTLPAPEKPAAPPGGGQAAPPAGEKPKPEAPPGGGAEKPRGTEAPQQ